MTNQKYAELQTQSRWSFLRTEKKDAFDRKEDVLQADLPQAHKNLALDAANEANHSSQYNLQSLSFNISSSR